MRFKRSGSSSIVSEIPSLNHNLSLSKFEAFLQPLEISSNKWFFCLQRKSLLSWGKFPSPAAKLFRLRNHPNIGYYSLALIRRVWWNSLGAAPDHSQVPSTSGKQPKASLQTAANHGKTILKRYHQNNQRSDPGPLLAMELGNLPLDGHFQTWAALEVGHLDTPEQCFLERSISVLGSRSSGSRRTASCLTTATDSGFCRTHHITFRL